MSDNENPKNNYFDKRDTIDLLEIIPECKNFKMVKSINDVFVILDEKISRILKAMMEMFANETKYNQFPSVTSLEKITADCAKIRALVELQQMKCEIIKDGTGLSEISTEETQREQYMLQNLCLEAKNAIPQTQNVLNEKRFFASPKKRCLDSQKRPKMYDIRVEGVRKSVYRAFLLFPKATFRLSEFLKENPGLQGMMKTVMRVLEREDLITIFPLATECRNDHLIVKDARPNVTQKTLKTFGLTKDEYFTCNRPIAATNTSAQNLCSGGGNVTHDGNSSTNILFSER